MFKINETTKAYTTRRPVTADEIVATALDILAVRLPHTDALTNPESVKNYLATQFAELEHEVFACLFLDNRHRVIRYEEMFRGTIDGCSVHPREVVKAALTANAAVVILAHNHPSGVAEPSRADTQLTRRLTDALGLVDVRVLDHIVTGGAETVSFCRTGLALDVNERKPLKILIKIGQP